MAEDVAALPATGINPVIGGDAHFGNFGFYASPERQLVLDINDFDEAHPGGWEWDLRRLTASIWVNGRQNGTNEDTCEDAVLACSAAYRDQMWQPATSRCWIGPSSDWTASNSSGSPKRRHCASGSRRQQSGRGAGPATGPCRASPRSTAPCAGSSRNRP